MTTNGGTTQPAAEESWPAAEERRPVGEQRWWKLLRRVFEIPEIVSDGNREDAVSFALLGPVSSTSEVDPQERLDNARMVVRALVKMGEKGELDDLFVPLSLSPKTKIDISHTIARELKRDSTAAFVDAALTRIEAYVKLHPFEDARSGTP
jgi:hypothetical protein